ncbi:MAG: DUF4230 domain-containing protein [Chloroflexi bacterium]|nr:DUF4230 domain-containing protein [Chloroflexota bacterium]
MTGLLKFIGRNFMSIALLVVGIVVGSIVVGKVYEVREFFFPETSLYVRSPITIVNSIRGIGQLVTVTSEVAKVDFEVELRRGFLNFAGFSAKHIVDGAIEAGIDFDAITEDSMSYENDAYTLTLPAPVITSCRVEYIKQNQHSFTLLLADWDMLRRIAHAEAIEGFAAEMIEKGILKRAEEETELRLGDFVREVTGKPVHILFEAQGNEPQLPDSCKPYTPSGWGKDENGSWKRMG